MASRNKNGTAHPALRVAADEKLQPPAAHSSRLDVLILASASPRRREILRAMGIPFETVAPDVDERCAAKNPRRLVEELAARKALAVSAKVGSAAAGRLILAADTVVALRGKIIGKPSSQKSAERMLAELSGTRHKVYTGIALVRAGSSEIATASAASTVKMRRLFPEEIKAASRKHLDKAGAYAIQEKNDAFVENIEGDYFNVVGLPVGLLKKMLRKSSYRPPRAAAARLPRR